MEFLNDIIINAEDLIKLAFQGIITFIIFVLGYYANRKHEKWKEKSRLTDIKVYYLSTVEFQISAIRGQIKFMLEAAQILRKIDTADFNFSINVNLNTDRLREIDQKDLFKAFVTYQKGGRKQKVDNFYSLTQNIDLVHNLKESYKELIHGFYPKHREYHENWNSNIEMIGNLKDKLVTESYINNQNLQEDHFLREFDLLFYTWSQNENYTDVGIAYKNFIIPLRNLCRKYPRDQRSMAIIFHATKCIYAYNNLTHLLEFSRIAIVKEAWKLRKCSFTLKGLHSDYYRSGGPAN